MRTVLIVDDKEMMRDSVGTTLERAGLKVLTASDGESALTMVSQSRPDAIVTDMRMPGMSGLALFERLADEGLLPLLPVIFLTGHGDVPTAVATVKRGAFDFVEKPFSNNTLVDRIEQALAASRDALAARDSRGGLRTRLAELTEREREVMRLVIEGKPNKLIADALDISVRTVEVHRARVFDKMQVKSAVELANVLAAMGKG